MLRRPGWYNICVRDARGVRRHLQQAISVLASREEVRASHLHGPRASNNYNQCRSVPSALKCEREREREEERERLS